MSWYDSEQLTGRGRALGRLGTRGERKQEARSRLFEAPADLRDWISPGTLKDWVEQEVSKLHWQDPRVVEYLNAHPDYRPRPLLSLLSFAYASRVFSSEEIARACGSDPIFRLVCENQVPFAQELRNFRRKNRRLLETILTGLFLRAVRERFELDSGQVSTELLQDLQGRAVERLNIARHMDFI